MSNDRPCPKCGLTNLPTAETCDCGYSFATGLGGKEPVPTKETWRKAIFNAALPVMLLACASFVLWNAFTEGSSNTTLVFTSPLLNVWAVFLALLSPLPAFLFIASRWRGVARGVGTVLAGVLVPFSLLAAIWVAILGFPGTSFSSDASFLRLREVPVGRYLVVVYRTRGALDPDGVIVRQELPLLPGLRMVRMIYQHDPAEDVVIYTLGEDTIRVVGVDAMNPSEKLIHLTPLRLFSDEP